MVAGIISVCTSPTLYKRNVNFGIILFLYIVFAVYNSLFRHEIGKNFLPVLQVFTIFLLFKNYAVMHLFFKYLKNIFLFLVVLAIINFILESFYGKDALVLIKDISYLDGTYEFTLYFPLTWSASSWDIIGNILGAGIHSRQYFFFIEPGMVPPFFISCIYIIWNDPLEKNKWMQTILFIIGLLLTFSTGGPLILLLSLAVWYISKNRKHLSPFSIIVFALGIYAAWYVFNYMPGFGRVAKMELSSQSAESVEIHENFGVYIIVGAALLMVCGLLFLKSKNNKVLPIVFATIIALGYLSNYIGYTLLATAFLFWDDSPLFNSLNSRTNERTLT